MTHPSQIGSESDIWFSRYWHLKNLILSHAHSGILLREFHSKPRPLGNIIEISTKNNRDHLLTKGNLPPKYETNLTSPLPLSMFTRNCEVLLLSPAHSRISMRYDNSIAWLLVPFPKDVTKPSWKWIGHFVLNISAFERFISKPRPLMNINEIDTKNNRDHLLTMGDLPPKYETNRTLRLPLIVFTRNLEILTLNPAHSWILMESAPKTIGTIYSLCVIYHLSMRPIGPGIFHLSYSL